MGQIDFAKLPVWYSWKAPKGLGKECKNRIFCRNGGKQTMYAQTWKDRASTFHPYLSQN